MPFLPAVRVVVSCAPLVWSRERERMDIEGLRSLVSTSCRLCRPSSNLAVLHPVKSHASVTVVEFDVMVRGLND